VIQDPCYCPTQSSVFSETQNTMFKSFSLRNNKNKEVLNFILNLIDTPGTFEIRAADQDFETRSNEKIGELIVECLNHEVTYLNMVVLFLTIAGSVNSREVDSIELFMKMFGGSGIPVILCITHADDHNKNKRDQIIDEIKRYPRLAEYFKTTPENPNPQLEILFMGCVDYIHRDIHDPRVMAEKYTEVEQWRNLFIKRIFAAETGTLLQKTNIYNTRVEKTCDVLKKCYSELLYLCKADPETSEYKRRLADNKPNMEFFHKNFLILQNDPVAKMEAERFWGLIQTIRKEASGYDQKAKDIKAELIHPWNID